MTTGDLAGVGGKSLGDEVSAIPGSNPGLILPSPCTASLIPGRLLPRSLGMIGLRDVTETNGRATFIPVIDR